MKLSAAIERVAIGKITVGVRRRQKLGNLRSLAKSIEEHGLLHPILLRNGHELVSGNRRLEACKSLGWTTVPTRAVDGMSDDELRAVELEENTERLDLTTYEQSKQKLAEIRQAEADARSEDLRPKSGRKGRPSEPGSERDVERRTGIPKAAQGRIEKHVAVAEQYPFMQQAGWRQYNVLEAAEKLEALPATERSKVAALLDQPGIPPKKAVQIIGRMAAMPPAERKEVFTLAKSDNAHERSVALTRAASLPPPPDPGLVKLIEAERCLRDAAKATRARAVAPDILTAAITVADLADRTRKDTTV